MNTWDNPHKKRPQDASKISMTEPHEVQYWTGALGVSAHQLQNLVSKYGHGVEAVRRGLAAERAGGTR
jgi:hypothetical protein